MKYTQQHPNQSEKLRELRPQQRHLFSLFIKSKELTVNDIAKHLGLKSRSAYTLVKKWIDDGFIQIETQSRKARTYGLTKEWELLIEKNQDQDVVLWGCIFFLSGYPKLLF